MTDVHFLEATSGTGPMDSFVCKPYDGPAVLAAQGFAMAGRPRSPKKAGSTEQDAAGHGGSIQALERGLALLSIIAEADGLSLTSAAQRAGIAASTAHRILGTLKAGGFVRWDESRGGYLVGVQAFRIGSAFLRNRKLADVGRSVMRDLAQASGETVNLAVEQDDHIVFLSQLESHHSIRAFHRPGASGPLHASGLGKAIIAALPENVVEQILHRVGLPRFTARTIVDPGKLKADLAAVRKRGWSIDDEERADGMRCVGAAVFNEHGEAVGAVSISGPTVRITEERLGELGPMVKRAAADMTERVGGRAPA